MAAGPVNSGLTRARFWRALAGYAALALATLIVAPFLGAETLQPAALLSAWRGEGWNAHADILLFQRLPRVCLGFVCGGTLALVGATFQVLLRNPLATPYTLGITSGGALGAALAIAIPGLAVAWGPFGGLQICALVGAGVVMAMIYRLARQRGAMAVQTLLLAGVTIGILCSALIMLLRYFLSPDLLITVERWMLGGLDVVGYRSLASTLPLVLPGVGLLLMLAPALNQLALGEELAAGYGVDVALTQRVAFLGGGLATAGVVSVAGPIGFVGLIVPHALRRLSGVDHRLVAPAALLAGGTFLVACDTLGRCLLPWLLDSPTELPVGLITSVLGAPVFIHLLLRQRA